MQSASIQICYIITFLVYLIWANYLELLNLRFAKMRGDVVPDLFSPHIELETYKRSIQYTESKTKLSVISGLVSSAVLLALIFSGALGVLDTKLTAFALGSFTHGVIYVLGLSFLLSLLDIPFSLYRTFVIEERFGFNKTTFKIWVADLLKGLILSFILSIPLLYGLFWFMSAAGSLWWLYAGLFITVFQLAIVYIYPVLISPLFNKFTPLAEGTLREKILALAQRVGFATSGIFIMDGSRRSAHGNAYFTGFGRNKRIVLFDTLVSELSEEQATAVLAHEIGHEKRHHIKKSMALTTVLTLVCLWLVGVLIEYKPLFQAFGFAEPSHHAALVIFAFASTPITFFIMPMFSCISRRFEYEADRFAIDAHNMADLRDALIALSKKSLSNLTPHPLYSFFHYSHPTLAERIAAMEHCGKKRNFRNA